METTILATNLNSNSVFELNTFLPLFLLSLSFFNCINALPLVLKFNTEVFCDDLPFLAGICHIPTT